MGAATLGGRSFASSPSDERYVLDASTVGSTDEMPGTEIVYDFRNALSDGEGIPFAVVVGDESAMPDGARYTPDVDVEIRGGGTRTGRRCR